MKFFNYVHKNKKEWNQEWINLDLFIFNDRALISFFIMKSDDEINDGLDIMITALKSSYLMGFDFRYLPYSFSINGWSEVYSAVGE